MKTSRLDTRVTPEQRALFERAAALGNFSSLTEFLTAAAEKEAREIIEHHEKMYLSQVDTELFINLLIDPPEPNEALRKAVEEYNESFE